MMHEGTGGQFDAVRRDALIAYSSRLPYKDFRRSLTPRFGLVWLHLLAGHVSLVIIGAAVVTLGLRYPALRLPLVAIGGPLFGYTFAYLTLFLHEATHYNIAPGRQWNDRLANLMIGSFSAYDIREYRRQHFGHHRRLGQPNDTERNYFDPLNMRFIVESLCGLRAIRTLAGQERMARERERGGRRSAAFVRSRQRVLAFTVNGAVIGGAFGLGWWPLSVAWAIGLLVFFPFFLAVRQVLEHRGDMADQRVDYHRVPHGAVNRIFGDGPLASTFGGAGFNRHLLHHWEPQVSYTRLKDLERYLMDTDLAAALDARRTTYLRTFRRLLNA